MSFNLIYAVHGFLGQSSDWNQVCDELNAMPDAQVSFNAEELFAENSAGIFGLDNRAKVIRDKLSSMQSYNGKKIFIGYSLGGRIGLHLLKNYPALFDYYVFLSTNPGLPEEAVNERKARQELDKKWSNNLKSEEWESFLKDWNDQPVFKGSRTEPARNLKEYDLSKLKDSLLAWSLGLQDDFTHVLNFHQKKVVWVVGSEDYKYCEIAEQLRTKNAIKDYIKINSGHRLWLDNPRAVAEVVYGLITRK